MFPPPSHLNNNSAFYIPTYNDLPQEDIGDQQDLILFQESQLDQEYDHPATTKKAKGKQKQKQNHDNILMGMAAYNNNVNIDEASVCDNNEKKKIIRRENERQRRLEMTNLCESLRSLLPFELIKGKRSVSDHLEEAATYIKGLKEKTQELQIKRDMLKHKANSSSNWVDCGIESSIPSSNMVKCVSISPFPGGIEIVMDSSMEESSSFPLSVLLEILIQQGCNVLSCVSTQVNGRLYHSIKAEVDNLACLDLAGLEQKLNNVILCSRYNNSE